MKKLIVTLAVTFFLSSTLLAQTPEKSAIELKAEIAALQSKLNDQSNLEQQFPNQFIGFGKELGTALNGFVEALDGGMQVTTTRVNEFAQTDVGRYAIIAIAWKIFADDIISIGGSAFNKTTGFILLFVFCWLLKSTIEVLCWGRMIVVKQEGPWYSRKLTKERSVALYKDGRGDDEVKVTAMVVQIIALICLFIAACVGLTH